MEESSDQRISLIVSMEPNVQASVLLLSTYFRMHTHCTHMCNVVLLTKYCLTYTIGESCSYCLLVVTFSVCSDLLNDIRLLTHQTSIV